MALLDTIKFALMRYVYCPLPVDRGVPLIGGKSAMELILSIVIVVIAGFTGSPSTCQIYGLLTVIFGMRSNLLLSLMGFSFQQMLLWHKIFGIGLLIALFIHGFDEGFNTTGVGLGVLIGLQLLSYVVMAKLKFDFFYYPHICIYVLIVAFAFLHGAGTFAMSIIIYGAELLIRHLLMQRKTVATISMYSDDHIKVVFPKTFSYSACQYAFLMVPAVNPIEFHPFTIASAPHEENLQFIIKVSGDWTKKLASLVGSGPLETALYFQGPYGGPTVDFHNMELYKTVLLVAGGVGITPGLALYKDLVHQAQQNGSFPRKIVLVWATKDAVLADNVYREHIAPLNRNAKLQDVEGSPKKGSYPPEFRVHLSQQAAGANIPDTHIPRDCIETGRPQCDKLFAELAQGVKEMGGSRIAMLVCGPASMVFSVKTKADQSILNMNCGAVRFDCQEEFFGF